MELKITKDNFEEQVAQSKGLLLLDFWATWCGPCRMLAPVLEELAEEGVQVGKVNVDEESELADLFHINSIPTLVLFQNGKPVKQSVGFVTKTQIEEMMKGV